MSTPRIGISACFFHADPQRAVFKGKTLLYLEQSLAHWLLSQKILAFMIPSVGRDTIQIKDLAKDLDGLVLQGGADVSPLSYGETPLKPEWSGDKIRDEYEIELFNAFRSQRKPILGVCRGAQLINVALGGTLYQDIGTQLKAAHTHRDWNIYDQNFHEIEFEKNSELSKLFPQTQTAKVNSVHHQAVKELGHGLVVEARSKGDGVVEAMRGEDEPFLYAVQWHPEFQDPKNTSLLDVTPILQKFIRATRKA